MSVYIDRQAAIDALGERPLNWDDNEFDMGLVVQFDADRRMLEAVPPTDAVEVVRCKDCKHADEYYHCIFSAIWNDKNHYCSQGERRNG